MPKSVSTGRRRCPRCGSHSVADDQAAQRLAARVLPFTRAYRCSAECGWRAIRFSRSRFQRVKRKLRVGAVVLLFFMAAAFTVRQLVMRVGPRPAPDVSPEVVE
jgi:hypothetical protein